VTWTSLLLSLLAHSIAHPGDGVALLRVGWRFRRRGWITRFPFLPLPSWEYVQWRMLTAYGDAAIVPPAQDLIRYARWAVRP
jgi:hypothetical protein